MTRDNDPVPEDDAYEQELPPDDRTPATSIAASGRVEPVDEDDWFEQQRVR
jgi:hypothetical protein